MLLLKSFIYVEKKSYCNGSTILSLNSKNSFNFDRTLILSSNKIIILDYFSSLMLKIHLALGFDLILALCTYLVIGTMCAVLSLPPRRRTIAKTEYTVA